MDISNMVYRGREYVTAGKIKGAKLAVNALSKNNLLTTGGAAKVGKTVYRILEIASDSILVQAENVRHSDWGSVLEPSWIEKTKIRLTLNN
ncbi:MAG: hypothetical protein HPY53_12460 [Brevinematales bacterium]|nr:hypothetical protein [Brevinematales bacterium]